MTVVVGMSCREGIVLASDSQMSYGYTQNPETKIWKSDDGSFAFGLSGAEGPFQRMRDALRSLPLVGSSVEDIRYLLRDTAVTELSTEYDTLRQRMGVEVSFESHGAAAIVATIVDGATWLFKIDQLARVTDHNTRGFVSIGSGGPLAEHAVTVFRTLRAVDGFGLFHSQVLAFRVIQDACAIGGPSAAIGGAVQLATVSSGGNGEPSVRVFEPDDPLMREQVANWTAWEAEHFREQSP